MVNGRITPQRHRQGAAGQPGSPRGLSRRRPRMSPLDTFMFDWFGDTLFNVVLFNLVADRAGLVRGRARGGAHLAAVAADRVLHRAAFGDAALPRLCAGQWRASVARRISCSAGRYNWRSRRLPTGSRGRARWSANIPGSTGAKACWAGTSGTNLTAMLRNGGEASTNRESPDEEVLRHAGRRSRCADGDARVRPDQDRLRRSDDRRKRRLRRAAEARRRNGGRRTSTPPAA